MINDEDEATGRQYGPWPRVEETIYFPVNAYPPKFVKLRMLWPPTEFEWTNLMGYLAIWKRASLEDEYTVLDRSPQ